MGRPFCTYKLIKTEYPSYFIGANSSLGFVSALDFEKIEKAIDTLYILKGGPGSGKSTFMKRASCNFDDSIYYYCSSDPDSLDAVFFTKGGKKIGICDGTSPHVSEMKYPAAVSQIINIGDFWNREELAVQKDEIVSLTEKKSALFKSLYKYLQAAADTELILDSISNKVCDTEKAENAVNRLFSKYKIINGKGGIVYTEAFSMNGCVAYDTFFKKAKQIYLVRDTYGISNIFLNLVKEYLEKNQKEHTVIKAPVNTNLISGLWIDSIEVLICHDNYIGINNPAKIINTKRFLSPEAKKFKNRFTFSAKCRDSLFEGACAQLEMAKEYHFRLEEIYSSSMDFEKLDKYRTKIFGQERHQ